MQTLESIKAIVANVKFNDWQFKVGTYGDGTPYIQVLFVDKDRITGKEEVQKCRKWILSFHMVDSEVIRTAFQAAQGAVIHEVQEAFTYKGCRIFNPHMDLETLVTAMKQKHIGISLRDETTYPTK